MERQFHSMFTSIVNYINVPPYLYRYENQEYIDDFFDRGNLMISSFFQYRNYEDNKLGDKSEGTTFNFGHTENEKTVVTVTTVGQNSYCFCTSTILSKTLFDSCKRNSVFRIKDPINFTLQIEKSLNRVVEVVFGNCIYVDKKMIIKRIPAVDLEKLKVGDETNNISFEKLMAATAPLNGPEQFFLKKIEYQDQCEFRILWHTDRTVNIPLIIHCPEAVKFCERIDLNGIN